MKAILSIIFLTVLHLSSLAQIQNRVLQVYSITEYIDGYVIKAIDALKHDTLNIISTKEIIKNKHNFEKVIVGRKYNFEFEDIISQMAASPTNNFVARIRTTVVWEQKDGLNKIPVYSRNIKGIWIKQ